jgi:hypothetical protein
MHADARKVAFRPLMCWLCTAILTASGVALLTLDGRFVPNVRADTDCGTCAGVTNPGCPNDTGSWSCCGGTDSDAVWYQP